MAWLTKQERQERQELDRSGRIALRRTRKLERWPNTNGRPPWLVRAEGVLLRVSQRAALILGRAALAAVVDAAAGSLVGGQLRHEFAVAALVGTAAAYAIDLAKEDAAGLVEDAYELLDDEGALD